MAWENYGWAWNVVGVQGSEYVVLMFLANEASSKGETPLLPIQKICRRCNLARRSVFHYINRLEAKGFVQRKRKWAKGPWDANAFVIDKTRYFPRGEYNDVAQLWNRIIDEIPDDEISTADRNLLKRIKEAFLQKNSRVLYLITTTDLYEETIVENIKALKKAAQILKQPIRRFE